MALRVHLYRHSNDGSAKDWAYPVDPPADRLAVYFGSTGRVLRLAETPAATCRAGSPTREVEQRVRDKLRKGYEYQGEFILDSKRKELTPAPGQPASRCLYWACRACAAADADDLMSRAFTLLTAAEVVIARLVEVDLADSSTLRIDRDTSSEAWQVVADRPAHRHRFGFNLSSEMGEGEDPALLDSAGNGTGVVAVQGVNALWIAFLILVSRVDASLKVANENGERVTGWPDELPMNDELQERLGFKAPDPARLLASLAEGDDDGWVYE